MSAVRDVAAIRREDIGDKTTPIKKGTALSRASMANNVLFSRF